MRRIDITGQKLGRWLVLGPAPRVRASTDYYCQCECGTERVVGGQNLRGGKSTSCGCFREMNRPRLSKNRDFSGAKNPRARKSIAANNGMWVPSASVWYKRASGIFYAAKKAGVPVGFPSAAAMASHVVSIAPEVCPVFGVKFVERGAGFSKWSPSIDKIDPKLGYVTGNIQVISMLANCMKRDATREQLYMFAEWVMKGEHHGHSDD